MIKETLSLLTIISSSFSTIKPTLLEAIPEFKNGHLVSYYLKDSSKNIIKLEKVFDSSNNYLGSYLLNNGSTDFIHIGTIDPYLNIKNGYYYNDFDDISPICESTTSSINQISDTSNTSYSIMEASTYSGTLPSVPSSLLKTSKSAYHYEWHLEQVPDYYQNFESTSPYYGIACSAVAAAMLIGFYDINCSKYSTFYPNYVMPEKYEDDPDRVQNVIEYFCKEFKLEQYGKGYSDMMVSGLNKLFKNRIFSLEAKHETSNAFQKMKDITSNFNPCIVHTENHWSLGIGYYDVRNDTSYGLVRVGWKSNRGTYMFKKDKIDGVIYIVED